MRWSYISPFLLLAACSSSQDGGLDPGEENAVESGGAANLAGSSNVGPASGSGGRLESGGGAGSTGGGIGTGGTAGTGGSNGARDAGGANVDAGAIVRPPPNPCIEAGSCPAGIWTNVTPPEVDIFADLPCGNYGTLSAQVDGMHPEILYTQLNCRGIWKSTDYGLTWKGPVNTGMNGTTAGDCAGGVSVPPKGATGKLYQACIRGAALGFWTSTNSGVDWTRHNVAPGGQRQDFYPPAVDPYDPNHLLMPGHEMNLMVRSIDGGESWTAIKIDPGMNANGGTGTLVFIDTGAAATTRNTWLYLAQGSGGVVGTWRTADAGTSWSRVDKNEKEHSYYQIYQPDTSGVVFMAGIYSGLGYGVLRSTDYGLTFKHVGLGQNENIVFGTPKHIYAMDAYSGQKLEVADAPGTGTWTSPGTPEAMAAPPGGCKTGYCGGAVQAAVTNDGTYNIILTANWNTGLWRYVEPVK